MATTFMYNAAIAAASPPTRVPEVPNWADRIREDASELRHTSDLYPTATAAQNWPSSFETMMAGAVHDGRMNGYGYMLNDGFSPHSFSALTPFPTVAAAVAAAVTKVANAVAATPVESRWTVARAYASYASRIADDIANGIAAVSPPYPPVGRE